MAQIASTIEIGAADFHDNAAQWRALSDQLAERRAQAATGGSETSRARHAARGNCCRASA